MKINPERYYAASTIIKNGWLPWILHAKTFKEVLETKEGQELYKPVVRTAGGYTYRKIKGETLIDVIKKADDGKLN